MLTLKEKSLVIDILNASYRNLRASDQYSDEQKIKYEIEISNIIDDLNLYGIKRAEPYPCKKLHWIDMSRRNRAKEKSILLEVYYLNFNFIARDRDGDLYAYRQRPVKHGDEWIDQEDKSRYYQIKDSRLFKQIEFSDQYPCYIREYVDFILDQERNEQRFSSLMDELYRKEKRQ